MRIIGGKFKGRRFTPPSNFSGRPTTDFAREALFNLLRSRVDLDGCAVLDLFAGTGAMSFEFISRGATSITAVEQEASACRFIKSVFDVLDFKKAFVLRDDVFKFLVRNQGKYDVVVADPPFDLEQVASLPDRIQKAELLNPGGLFVLEHGPEHKFDSHVGFQESRRYGSVHFSFFNFEV
jgi:16S rRNA (guanine(966)-N(2))-methyltransferase RsmD